jgi:hypothetical protein
MTSTGSLDEAVDLLRYREGPLEVVYVAHVPIGLAMGAVASPEAFAEYRKDWTKRHGPLPSRSATGLRGKTARGISNAGAVS